MTPVPRGVHSTRQHEPIDQEPQEPLPPEEEIFGEPPPPERETVLEAEIEAIIVGSSHDDIKHTARRILKIEKIRLALQMYDDHEAGLCDITYYTSTRPESSDAR